MRMLIISCVLSVYLVIIKREKKLCSKDIYFTLVACLAVSVIPMDCFFRMISKAGISILLPEDVYVIRTIITCVYVVVDSINNDDNLDMWNIYLWHKRNISVLSIEKVY